MSATSFPSPFHKAIAEISTRKYHNQRTEEHSDAISDGMLSDLIAASPELHSDLANNIVSTWRNVGAPGDRARKAGLVIAEPLADGSPNVSCLRFALENKSVITAHRNKTNRFDDLTKTLAAIRGERPEAIVVATVLIGVSERYLNVADRLKAVVGPAKFKKIEKRLATGDERLWDEFQYAVSRNRPADWRKTVELFKSLPIRNPVHTHEKGFDAVLLAPVQVDNVNPPTVAAPQQVGIDVVKEYRTFVDLFARVYKARWHI